MQRKRKKKKRKRKERKKGDGKKKENRNEERIGGVIDDKQERDVRNFFNKNPMPGTERVLEQTLERVRIRSKFLQRVKTEFT